MKILQLGKFYTPVSGGVETVTFDLAEGLVKKGIDVDVLCANTSCHSTVDIFSSGYRVFRSASLGIVASTSIAPGIIWNLARAQNNYDVIHVHLPNPLANLALWLTRPKSKIVVHWHSDIVKQKYLLKLYEPLQQWLLARADVIISTSPPYMEASPWLSRWRKKVVVIPIGINVETLQIQQESLNALRLQYPGKKIIFSLGRLTYYKGFEFLIDAAKCLPDDVVVLIGGGGELCSDLEKKINSAGLRGKVVLLGKISASMLPAYYALADVFCLPSIARSEAFGVVLLEAMAMGKPIVATRIAGSGVPWVNQDGITGVNVKPMDAFALASALMKILDSPDDLSIYAKASKTRFEDEFTASKMVDSVIDVYRQTQGSG